MPMAVSSRLACRGPEKPWPAEKDPGGPPAPVPGRPATAPPAAPCLEPPSTTQLRARTHTIPPCSITSRQWRKRRLRCTCFTVPFLPFRGPSWIVTMLPCPTVFICRSGAVALRLKILRFRSGRRHTRTSGWSTVPRLVSTWHMSGSTLTITPKVVWSRATRSWISYSPRRVRPCVTSAHSTRSLVNTFTFSLLMSVNTSATCPSTLRTIPVSPSYRPPLTFTWSPVCTYFTISEGWTSRRSVS
mmetsp:Transcript_4306/g.12029  ORF Transcript_4306/g.12029 Transcript_4306/m.12029 type:complete len:244 (-) Transcript_4306:1109-1840(-)